jgi:transcriptional regulator with XRE-family HTH domain
MLRVREARILCEASIYQVSEEIGMHAQEIKEAELGIRPPRQKLREALAEVYGIPENILFWDWDKAREFMVKKGGGLRRALREYKGRKGIGGPVHRRIQPNDD